MHTTSTTTKEPMAQKQADRLASCKEELKERFLHHSFQSNTLNIYYRTKGGYYVQASYNPDGIWTHSNYFQNWNEIDLKPFNLLFSRPKNI